MDRVFDPALRAKNEEKEPVWTAGGALDHHPPPGAITFPVSLEKAAVQGLFGHAWKIPPR